MWLQFCYSDLPIVQASSSKWAARLSRSSAFVMPIATEYFGYTALNYGPLTTTFTADPLCATATEGRVIYRSDNLRYQIAYAGDCATTTASPYYLGCFPSAGKEMSLFASDVPVGVRVASYYSPGVACPSGWTTAGTMARATGAAAKPDAWNGTGSLAGDIWETGYDDTLGREVPLLEVYRQIKAPDETLAFCCPSYETITTVISSTVTTRFVSIVTEPEPSKTVAPLTSTPLASVYAPSEIAEMVVMTVVAAVPLIHKASDVPNAAAGSLAPAAGGALAMVVLSLFAGARMIFSIG
ncbi:uncharacterized protein PG986_002740 [Apiospora aurea]|uniref:Uncharacterized protein n=1 Tax=Apiospora aurea TaxID=335848 RepID=A0ABR1QPV5_9PEZI